MKHLKAQQNIKNMDAFDKKIIAAILILLALLATIWILGINALNKEEKRISSKVGQSVVVGNDTLIITDYSLIQNTYILSNGTSVSTEFVTNKN